MKASQVTRKDPQKNAAFKDYVEFLENHPQSPLSKFFTKSPVNDYEYLNHWFSYLEAILDKPDYAKKILQGQFQQKEDLSEIRSSADLRQHVFEYLSAQLHIMVQTLSFEPRVEQYIRQFPAAEQQNARLLLIAFLLNTRDDVGSHNCLLDLARLYNIPISYVFTINEEHPFIKDKIITLEKGSVLGEKPIQHKRFEYNPPIYAIFAGLHLSEEELLFYYDTNLPSLFKLRISHIVEDQDEEDGESEILPAVDIQDSQLEDHIVQDELSKILSASPTRMNEAEPAADPEMLQPYRDDLDYLWQEHQRIVLRMKYLNTAKQELVFNELGQNNDVARILHQLNKLSGICRLRLSRTVKQGSFLPRLEQIVKALKLSDYEKNTLLLLTTIKLFVNYDESPLDSGQVSIKQVMIVNEESPLEITKSRKYFTKNAKLFKYGLVHMDSGDYLEKDFYDRELELDNRLVEFFAGQNYDISDFIEGSNLYRSTISLEHVILPKEQKTRIQRLSQVYPQFLKTMQSLDLSEVSDYGKAQVYLFVGPSGTGKTMLANALSNQMDMRVLLFNLSSDEQSDSYRSISSRMFSYLFREARMNQAILFFDESEALLSNRSQDLLVQIEKHEGIVIFATNASFKVDEAMRRRINHIIEFQEPSSEERLKIWKVHLPASIPLDPDVDLKNLAERYEINGGLIKNAVFSAISKAVYDNSEKLLISQMHLEEGAKEQLQNKLFMSKKEKDKTPQRGLDSLVVDPATGETIREIVQVEKNQLILKNQWGFDEIYPERRGTAILFHGPSGTGKSLAAECIAYEMGKNLKVVNYAHILSMWVGQAEKALEELFVDVANSNSILLFDEADALFASRSSVRSATDRYANTETDVLLQLIEDHSVFTILTTNLLDNIDNAFMRRFQYTVEFKRPSKGLRAKLWRTLIPEKLPLQQDVNIKTLAERYELSGGEIKNVVFRVANKHASKTLPDNAKIGMADFAQVCNDLQSMKNSSGKIGF